MTASFPKGFKCPPLLREMYPECEREMLPYMRFKARRLRSVHYLDEADAIQEGRIALLSALVKYDMNRCEGSLKRYVGVALDNCYRDMLYKALAQARMPRGLVRDFDGNWRITPVAPMSLDQVLQWSDDLQAQYGDSLASPIPDPEFIVERSTLEQEAQRFKMKLMNRLKGREKDVFECKVNPSTELLKMCDNIGIEIGCPDDDGETYGIEVPNYAIAKFLGINKNQVDWCVYKIKGIFTRMARGVDFSELFGSITESRGWPVIHARWGSGHDRDFQRKVIAGRKLGAVPVDGWDREDDHFSQAPGCSRWIERYPWGMVMVLRRDEECVTLIIEGKRVNLSTGAVFGEDGLREDIVEYVPWYRDLVKRLKEATS